MRLKSVGSAVQIRPPAPNNKRDVSKGISFVLCYSRLKKGLSMEKIPKTISLELVILAMLERIYQRSICPEEELLPSLAVWQLVLLRFKAKLAPVGIALPCITSLSDADLLVGTRKVLDSACAYGIVQKHAKGFQFRDEHFKGSKYADSADTEIFIVLLRTCLSELDNIAEQCSD